MDTHIPITCNQEKTKSFHILKDVYKPYNNPNLTYHRQFTCFSKDNYNFYCPGNAQTYVRMLNEFNEGNWTYIKELIIIE